MDYGPYTALVEEIIDAVSHARTLRPSELVEAHGGLVIENLDTATDYAWSRQIAGDESETWKDLRENQAAPLHAVPYDRPETKPEYDAVVGLLEHFLGVARTA